MKKNMISVVIPFYNEAGNIIPLLEEVQNSLEKDFADFSYEIIMVDDGSSDDSWKDIKKAKKINKNVVGIKSNRNYGQATTLQIWFDAAKWEYVFSLDGDGQNNPADFIKLYKHLQKNKLDVVAGWRKKRKDPTWMLVITKSARFLRGLFIKDGVHDSGCTLRIYKNKVVKNLELWGEMHRFIIALSKLNGYKIWEIVVNHRAREIWESKYNWRKSFKGLIDLIYIWFIRKYEWRPLHLFGFVGLVNFWLGFLMLFFTLYQRIFLSMDISDNGYFIMWIFLSQIGVMLFIFGIIIDLLIRNNQNTSKRNKYIIEEQI